MKYKSAYRIPELDPMGFCDTSKYLIVNSAGFYEFYEFVKPTYRMNGRRDYYLIYNLHGQMMVRIKDVEYKLEPGSVFLYRPFEEQYYGYGDVRNFISYYWVHFTGYGVEELLREAGMADERVFHAGMSQRIIDYYDEMIAELRDKNEGYLLAAATQLAGLISFISRKNSANKLKGMDGIRNELYKTIIYIHENYNKQISVKELAAMVHLCPDRYTCLFKEVMQVTPKQFLIKLRIQKACELMQRTSLNIRQISEITGFNDQLYFSRMFKKYVNLTPSEYMQKNR